MQYYTPLIVIVLALSVVVRPSDAVCNVLSCPSGGSCFDTEMGEACAAVVAGSINCNSGLNPTAYGLPPRTLCNGGATPQVLQFTLNNTLSTNYTESLLTVMVGPASGQNIACTGVGFLPNTFWTNPTVRCSFVTPLNTKTTDYEFLIRVSYNGTGGNYALSSLSEVLSFSKPPQITSVSGCFASSDGGPTNQTYDCPTSGKFRNGADVTLTIHGVGLWNYETSAVGSGNNGKTQVLVNSAPCTLLNIDSTGSNAYCTLPAGVGSSRSVQVVSGGQLSDPVNAVSYGLAVIERIDGCMSGANQYEIQNCKRTGGAVNDTITIRGYNFGAALAKLLVHGALAQSVVHKSGDAHNELTFVYPAGAGAKRSILFLQNGGGLTVSNATISYAQCVPGYRSDFPLSVNCLPCAEATSSSKFDADICSPCPTGKASGPAPSATCSPCEPGSYKSFSGTPNCTSCEPGKHQPLDSQPQCEECLPGKFATGYGNQNCTDCPVQSYSSQPGSTFCLPCDGIRYQTLSGQTTCQTCSSGQYHPLQGAETCLLCPLGATCSPDGIVAADGYYVYFDEDSFLHSDPCLPGYCETCPHNSSVALANTARALSNDTAGVVFSCCSVNRVNPYQNPFCGACNQDYFLWADECSLCKETDPGLVFLFLLIAWISVIVFHLVAQLASPDMRIFINFIQFVFLFLLTQSSTLSAWLAVFNFNIAAALGKTCVAPLTDMQRLASGLYVPVIGFLLLCANIILHYGLWLVLRAGYCQMQCCTETGAAAAAEAEAGIVNGPATERRNTMIAQRKAEAAAAAAAASGGQAPAPQPVIAVDEGCCSPNPVGVMCQTWRLQKEFTPIFDSYRRTALAFIATSYPSLTQSVLTFFSCKSFNHDSFVTAYPAISCKNDASYQSLIPIFAVLLIFVIILPLLFFFRLWQLNRDGVLFDKKIRFVYGGLIDGYTASKYYWEVFVLIKRLVIAVVALDAYNNQLPQKFTYLCLCNIIFLGIHFIAKPFSLQMDNYAESLSLITLVLLSLFLINAPSPLNADYSAGLTAMCFIVAAVFLLRIILVRYRALLDFSNRRRSTGASKDAGKKSVGKKSVDYEWGRDAAHARDAAAANGGTPASPSANTGFGSDMASPSGAQSPVSGAGANSEIAMVPLGASASDATPAPVPVPAPAPAAAAAPIVITPMADAGAAAPPPPPPAATTPPSDPAPPPPVADVPVFAPLPVPVITPDAAPAAAASDHNDDESKI